MPTGDAVNSTPCCTRFDAAPQKESLRRPRKRLTKGLGYFALFVVAVSLLTVNNAFLRAMANDVSAKQRVAEETTKPAEIDSIAIVSPDCKNCYDVNALIATLGSNPMVKMTSTRTVDDVSAEGAALVNQYKMTRLPSFIIRGQTQKLLTALPGIVSFGQLDGDVFVGSKTPAPYFDLVSGKARGEFTATFITEKQCKECYDPTVNRQALAQFGMKAVSEQTVDRTDPDGLKLVKQYAITTTPTIVLTGDMTAYEGFDQVWKNVGTVETDGAYVFRTGQTLMGTYYDLATKKPVVPPTTSGEAGSGSTGNTNTNSSTN